MGCYVNPVNVNKEAWLEKNATWKGTTPPDWSAVPQGELPVCLVDNGAFSAAGVAYSSDELRVFSDPRDVRHKRWYIVPTSKLHQVSPLKLYL